MTERVLVLVPVAQVLVQADQAVQAETLQSTGQPGWSEGGACGGCQLARPWAEALCTA
mgnify:CR=1 FL=1